MIPFLVRLHLPSRILDCQVMCILETSAQVLCIDTVLSIRPGSHWSSGWYSLANHWLYSCIFNYRKRGPFYQLRQVLAKGRHLLQFLLKALIDSVWLGHGIVTGYSHADINIGHGQDMEYDQT